MPKQYEATQFDVGYWLCQQTIVTGTVPSKDAILARFDMSRATAYRARARALEKLDEQRAQLGLDPHASV